MRLLNEERAAAGMPAVVANAGLAQAAEFHNAWMSAHDCFDHACPGEPDWQARARMYGESAAFEVIAGYPLNARAALDLWKSYRNQTGHWNRLMSGYSAIGCAVSHGLATCLGR